MLKILGKKIGMSHCFNEAGEMVPVTIIEAGPCRVVQVKTVDIDGYNAVQIGFDAVSDKALSKPQRAMFAKVEVPSMRLLREISYGSDQEIPYKVGDEVKADVLEKGLIVDVTAISKGKGFAGVMKRHNFKGGKASHGAKWHRRGGAIGMCADPARTPKGMRMAGRMGWQQVTVQNLEVVHVDTEKSMVAIKGGIPSAKGGYVLISTKNGIAVS